MELILNCRGTRILYRNLFKIAHYIVHALISLIYRITKADDLKDEVYEIDTEVDQVDEVMSFHS